MTTLAQIDHRVSKIRQAWDHAENLSIVEKLRIARDCWAGACQLYHECKDEGIQTPASLTCLLMDLDA